MSSFKAEAHIWNGICLPGANSFGSVALFKTGMLYMYLFNLLWKIPFSLNKRLRIVSTKNVSKIVSKKIVEKLYKK